MSAHWGADNNSVLLRIRTATSRFPRSVLHWLAARSQHPLSLVALAKPLGPDGLQSPFDRLPDDRISLSCTPVFLGARTFVLY